MTMIPTPLPATKGKGKERTPEQLKAGERNFAMFQLKGMLAHLKHLHGHVDPKKILAIQESVQAALYDLAHPVDPNKFADPKVPYLQDWHSVLDMSNQQLYVRGTLFGSSKFADNSPVRTSYINGADRSAGTIQTVNGSTYLLRGNPEAFNRICLRFGV